MFLAALTTFAVSPLYAVGLRLGATATAPSESAAPDAAPTAQANASVTTEVTVEPSADSESALKEVSWLGLSTTEAPESLAAQLDLQPGVGLVINYIAPDSPAARAGLRKNDVLTQFEDQSLVHPAQLRKLVHVRPEGTAVKLSFYRAGKVQSVSVTLGKAKVASVPFEEEERALKGSFNNLQKRVQELHLNDTVRQRVRILRDSLGNMKLDQKEVEEDIQRGMDQARTAIRDALRNMTNADSALSPLRKVLEDLAHSGLKVDDRADVVVRSSGKSSKSLVQSDESGTIVLLANPGLQLTAHDKSGKLLFDGPIDTVDQRARVPADLWARVDPLVEQMRGEAEKPDGAAADQDSSEAKQPPPTDGK
jgi:hypothetical protein